MRLHRCYVIGATVLGLYTTVTAAQDLNFVDTEFDLTHYAISAYPWPGDVTTFNQTLDGGNPGAALQDITTRASATNGSRASNYIINTNFSYDPSTAGRIESVDLSIQTYWQSSSGPLTNNPATFVITQGANFYIHAASLPALAGTWLTAHASDLVAADFALVTDLRNRTTEPSRNPDFGGDLLQFGFMTGLTITGNFPTFTRTSRADNFSITLVTTPVPEPASWALMAGGLLAIGALHRRRRVLTQ